jgi:hypothetical protein
MKRAVEVDKSGLLSTTRKVAFFLDGNMDKRRYDVITNELERDGVCANIRGRASSYQHIFPFQII